MRLTQMIEALLFASDAPLSAADLARIDDRLDEDTISAVIDELRREYEDTERSFQIYEIAGGYQLLTRPEYAVVLEQWETVPQTTRLSLPALEVLAIIAYRQPIGRAEIEEIRGVQSAAVLRTLQDRGLIDTVGRAEGLGRPMLYGTTQRFLEHFGFRGLEDLPRPDELPVVLRVNPEVTEKITAEDAEDAEGTAGVTGESAAAGSGGDPDLVGTAGGAGESAAAGSGGDSDLVGTAGVTGESAAAGSGDDSDLVGTAGVTGESAGAGSSDDPDLVGTAGGAGESAGAGSGDDPDLVGSAGGSGESSASGLGDDSGLESAESSADESDDDDGAPWSVEAAAREE